MGKRTGYKPADWLANCDICGRTFYASQLSKTWDESMRCSQCYEGRHPQDFVRSIPDIAQVPWTRPDEPITMPLAFTGTISAVFPNISLGAGQGALFPVPNNALGQFFLFIVYNADDPSDREIMKIVDNTADVLTAGQRGMNGTRRKFWDGANNSLMIEWYYKNF